MREVGDLMSLLQQADSFFPSGAVAFSWGLETLHSEGQVRDAEQVASFLLGQLRQRWASFDRVVLAQVYRAMPDLDAVRSIDRDVEALTPAREAREGSRRAGATLLRIHAQLETPHAQTYRERVQSGAAHGHLPVVQALLWHASGFTLDAALAASAHSLCVGMLGAAIRLGALGHVDAQRILQRAREAIRSHAAPEPGEQPSSFVPGAEIAMLRHETQHARLFMN
jgi:urease accessory protein